MSPRGRLLLRAWAPPAAWCAVLFLASSLPIRTDDDRFRGADKGAHLVEYAVLGVLAARALLLVRPGRGGAATVALGAALCTAYGLSDELHQVLVPNREFEWADLGADALGGALGAGGWTLGARRRATAPGTGGSPDPRPSGPPGP